MDLGAESTERVQARPVLCLSQFGTGTKSPSVGIHGDGFTPLAGSYSAAEPYILTSASMARYVFDASNWENSRWVVPLGASGHPGSSHYSDQAETWANVALLPMLYDWEAVSLQSETHQSLLPATE